MIKNFKDSKAFLAFKISILDSTDLELNKAKEQDFLWEDLVLKEHKKYSEMLSTIGK